MATGLREKLALFDPTLPLARAHTIPSLWYFDTDIYEAEREYVFGNTWQPVARVDQLPGPGSYVTADVAGEPVVVVRDEAGRLQAFSNVCRHRAARVMTEPCGQASRLRCNYHGWTYDLHGQLRGVTEFEGVEGFLREQQGLPKLSVDVWGPYVFVHLAPQPPTGLADYLSPLPARCQGLGLDKLVHVERREYDMACNWKVFVDNYQDGGYHINTVHPALASAVNYAEYRNEMGEHASVQISPLKPSDDPDINRLRSGDTAYYWWVFPNFIVNIYSGVMDTNIVLPLGPDRCKVIFDFFFPPPAGDEDREHIRRSMEVSHQIQLEDMWISQEVQLGLHSRTYRSGRFSVRREEPVYFFHKLLAKYLSQVTMEQ